MLMSDYGYLGDYGNWLWHASNMAYLKTGCTIRAGPGP